jgi:hypothetical protein
MSAPHFPQRSSIGSAMIAPPPLLEHSRPLFTSTVRDSAFGKNKQSVTFSISSSYQT